MKINYFILALFLCISCSSISKAQKPNVIFIMCDDLNDYQGVFGGHPQAQTPNIDRLATEGVQFVNAQSNVPVCQPSRNSLFTGVYPHDSKDFGWTKHNQQEILQYNKTLPELFAENGYYTLASGKLLHGSGTSVTKLWQEWGEEISYNYGPFPFDGSTLIAHPDVPSPYREIGSVDGSFGRLSVQGENGWVNGWDFSTFRYVNENDRDLMQDEKHAVWAAEKLATFESAGLSKPFFMGVGFVNPHTPLLAPDRFFELFPIDELELDDWLLDDEADTYYQNNFDPDMKGLRYYRELLASYGGDRDLALKHFLQAYLACVAFVDEQIGVILDALENTSFKNNTIVILTSDHGWQMGEKSYLFKNSPWEESARVPLVIKTPDCIAGSKVEHPVSLIDIYPTLMDYASITGNYKKSDEGGDLGGHSLRPFILNPTTNDWVGPEGALTVVGNFGASIPVHAQNYSYRTKDYRYILYSDGNEELYNHVSDPYEWCNLINQADYVQVNEDLKAHVLALLPPKDYTLFYDNFEDYSLDFDLRANTDYLIWGNSGNGTFTVVNASYGIAPYEGDQFGVTHAGWSACIRKFALKAGASYRFSVATIANSEKANTRNRSITISSGEHTYLVEDVDNSINGWVQSDVDFMVQSGLEKVTVNITGAGGVELAIDNYQLEELPKAYIKLADDGLILEGHEEGEMISVRLNNDKFTEVIDLTKWIFNDLPPGVVVSSLTRISDTRVMIGLSGVSSVFYEGVDIKSFGVVILNSQLISSTDDLSANTGVVFRADANTSNDVLMESVINLYPNPSHGTLYVKNRSNNIYKVEVYTLNGIKVYEKSNLVGTVKIQLPSELKGNLLMRINEKGTTSIFKLIVK